MSRYKNTELKLGVIFSKEDFNNNEIKLPENFKEHIKSLYINKYNFKNINVNEFEKFTLKYVNILKRYIFKENQKLAIFYRPNDNKFSYYIFATEREMDAILKRWSDDVTTYKAVKYKNFLRKEKIKDI